MTEQIPAHTAAARRAPLISFRTRIALLATTSTAVILLVSAIAVYFWLVRTGVLELYSRVDRQARIMFESPFWPPPWGHMETGFREEWRGAAGSESDPSLLMLIVRDKDSRTMYVSDAWPSQMPPARWFPSLKIGSDWATPEAPVTPQLVPGTADDFADPSGQLSPQRAAANGPGAGAGPMNGNRPGRGLGMPPLGGDSASQMGAMPMGPPGMRGARGGAIGPPGPDGFGGPPPMASGAANGSSFPRLRTTQSLSAGATGERSTVPPSLTETASKARYVENVDGHTWIVSTYSARGYSAAFAVDRAVALLHVASARNAFLVALPISLLLSFAAASLLVSRTMNPLRELTKAITRINAEGLNERISVPTHDLEFAGLVNVFNSMLDRLQTSFDNAQRFTGNAAHELKTPLAILQGKLEQAIRSEQLGSQRQQFLTDLLEEVARLKSITERLLLLARADAGRLRLNVETVDISELLESSAEDAQLLAPQLKIKTHIPSSVRVRCDRAMISQVVQNMVTNAIKYNIGPGGRVYLELGRMSGKVIVRVTNTGRPIPEDMQKRIFERFNRGDRSRSGRVEGSGLGLSLSREIARAHSGELFLDKSNEEKTRFVLELPAGSRSSSGKMRAVNLHEQVKSKSQSDSVSDSDLEDRDSWIGMDESVEFSAAKTKARFAGIAISGE